MWAGPGLFIHQLEVDPRLHELQLLPLYILVLFWRTDSVFSLNKAHPSNTPPSPPKAKKRVSAVLFYGSIYSEYSWFFLINPMKTGIGQSKYCIPQPFSRCLISFCSSLFDFNSVESLQCTQFEFSRLS